jgi:hypothetical protein
VGPAVREAWSSRVRNVSQRDIAETRIQSGIAAMPVQPGTIAATVSLRGSESGTKGDGLAFPNRHRESTDGSAHF